MLILTNPYSYETALNRALASAREGRLQLKVVFAIDPNAVDELMRDLGENGWLGIGSRRSLQASMLEGYRALAADILQEVEQLCVDRAIAVNTEVKEAPLSVYLQSLVQQGSDCIWVSASKDLSPLVEKIPRPVEWILED
ncbi:hypothetical protein JJD41_18075 [Oxynema sp. CENA135]|nr:hypothetical protein [Oxynema sp. CENA135]